MIDIIKKYNIKAKKSLGQNFLVNSQILESIGNITPITKENILEVGPGFGALTSILLSKKPKSLTLIELDNSMIDILNDRISSKDLDIGDIRFEIINKDVLKFEPNLDDYKIIANIPYYITSPILYRFLYDTLHKPKEMIILMQKEVGDRILSGQNFCIKDKTKSKKSSVLSLFIGKKALVEESLFVGKDNFIPPPKIDSSVLHFILHNKYQNIDDLKFLDFIKKSFREPRKKLIKNLVNSGFQKENLSNLFSKLDINLNSRPEDLGIEDYIEILESI